MFIYKFDMKREEIDMSTEYMKENGFYEQLEKTAVVPVVVLEKVEDAVPRANALVKGGLPAAEVKHVLPLLLPIAFVRCPRSAPISSSAPVPW